MIEYGRGKAAQGLSTCMALFRQAFTSGNQLFVVLFLSVFFSFSTHLIFHMIRFARRRRACTEGGAQEKKGPNYRQREREKNFILIIKEKKITV